MKKVLFGAAAVFAIAAIGLTSAGLEDRAWNVGGSAAMFALFGWVWE